MTGHVSLLLMASLIILEVVRSISGSVRLKMPTNSIKWDHNMLKRLDENKRYPRVRMVKRALGIEDRVFLKTNKSPVDTFQRQSRKDVLNDYNDLAMMKNERLWNDNLIRRLKKRTGVWDDNLVRRWKKERVWDTNLVRMI